MTCILSKKVKITQQETASSLGKILTKSVDASGPMRGWKEHFISDDCCDIASEHYRAAQSIHLKISRMVVIKKLKSMTHFKK